MDGEGLSVMRLFFCGLLAMVLAMGCASTDPPMEGTGGSGGTGGSSGTGGSVNDGGVDGSFACDEVPALGGELGGPCRAEAECNGVLECLPVQTESFGGPTDPIHDHPDGPDTTVITAEFVGNYCTRFFEPFVAPEGQRECTQAQATACAEECGVCDPYYDNATICLRGCRAEADTNSSCFDAYQCDLLFEACYPGCQSDNDCRIFREDTNDNGVFDPWDPDTMTGDRLVYDIDSTFSCNTDTYRCEHPGAPGAEAGIACDDSQQCEANGTCLDEEFFGFPGGYCSKVRCDIDLCAGDGICSALGLGIPLCAQRCQVGSGAMPPDTSTYLGNTQGCRPEYTCFWAGVAADPTGSCVPGEFNDVVDNNVGSDCTENSQCYSPFGQGACGDADLVCALTGQEPGTCPVGFGCTVFDCAVPGMPEDVCGVDGQCLETEEGISWCVAKCSAAENCLPGAACVDLDGDALTLDTVCLPFCGADTECRQPGETCEAGVCTPVP
jgi:hypothetical protein